MTHIMWDSLTEGGGVLGMDLPFLRVEAVAGLTVGRVLQHVSTFIGLLIIALWCVRRLRSGDLRIDRIDISRIWARKRLAIAASISLVSVTFAIFSVLRARGRETFLEVEHVLSILIKSGIAAAVLGVLIYATVWHIMHLAEKPVVHGRDTLR